MSEINAIEENLHAISEEAKSAFSRLSPDQLNWKPGPDKWSVAQCLEHLITTNQTYEPILNEIAAGTYHKTMWARLPIFPSLWAKLFLKSLDPANTKKLKAPKKFEPAQSNLSAAIVDEFVSHQDYVVQQIKATDSKHPERIVISSPAAKFITYTLMDAYRIMVVHEQRHLAQAKRVVANAAFPG